MRIGVIVYSQTGHTLQVAERVKERLIGEGHSVALEQITVAGGRTPKTKEFELDARPSVDAYDAIVFASYVEAFSLCAVMARYLKQMGSLRGKQVACLVTQQFPYPWMGGSRAIKQMKQICQSKGAVARATGIVNWAQFRREVTMAAAVDRIGKAF
ncbi:flavodoxin [Candidatus Bipolaricaulota bacterium]|nr:flavodoxin [Candidatus Bipolaricaulota bacterium]